MNVRKNGPRGEPGHSFEKDWHTKKKRESKHALSTARRPGSKNESTFRVEVEVVTLTAHSVSKSASHGDNEKGRQRPLPKTAQPRSASLTFQAYTVW